MMTRQRRHVNGNSNAAAPASVEMTTSGWGSGRTIPVNITSTLKRLPPASTLTDPVSGASAVHAYQHERRSGAATARRPQSSGGRDFTAGRQFKRRVQSARGPSEGRRRPFSVEEEVASAFVVPTHSGLPSQVDNSLPTIQPQVSDQPTSTSANNKVRVAVAFRGRTPRASINSSSGMNAASQVQWTVKMRPTTPVETIPDSVAAPVVALPLEPAELTEFRRLLQDRYREKRSVRQAFLSWDTNKDGQLCVDELREMLTRLGFANSLGREKVSVILKQIAAMPDSSLRYDAFCNFIYGTSELQPSSSSRSCNSTDYVKHSSSGTSLENDELLDPDCVVSLLRTKYERHKIRQVFRDWDMDKNGGVTLAELESNLRRQGLRIAKPQLMKLFDTYDVDHDGRLLYGEFMHFMFGPVQTGRHISLKTQNRQQEQKNDENEEDPMNFFRRTLAQQQTTHVTDNPAFRDTLQQKLHTFASRLNDAYAAFDDDHDGSLSYRELCQGLQDLGLNLTEREFLQLATRVDMDSNGEISFKEFCDVFGSIDMSRTPQKRAQSRDEEQVEDKEPDRRKAHAIYGSQRQQRASELFDFAHLPRRLKTPTRWGRTPYHNTKGLVSNQDEAADSSQFTTETQLYGNSYSSSAAKMTTTLGQEEKQYRHTAKASRLRRLRAQIDRYDAQTQPQHDPHDLAQERRVRTLQRQQERYHQRLEEQRPRQPSPMKTGIQIFKLSSTAPFV